MNSKEELIKKWKSAGIITDRKVFWAFKKIRRENFIKEKSDNAYGDYPLPIGYGQTISQPATAMVMTEALELNEGDKVLEVGSGSGYQAAIISYIVGKSGLVISTEIIGELAKLARENIKKSKITNVQVINCDGSLGYEKGAPYDKIIITAACPEIPEIITKQLREKGIIVAPIGDILNQIMVKAIKISNKLEKQELGHFVFVPLKGRHGFC